MTSPFDYLNAINQTKKDMMVDELSEKEYNAFLVNRGLSYFNDTILYANEMNIYHHLDSKLQFSFLLHSIRKRNRFSKWMKPVKIDDLNAIKEYYGYSNEKTRQVITLLTEDQIKEIKLKLSKGGSKIN